MTPPAPSDEGTPSLAAGTSASPTISPFHAPTVVPTAYHTDSPTPFVFNSAIDPPVLVFSSVLLALSCFCIVWLPCVCATWMRRQREREYEEEFSRRERQYRQGLRRLRTYDRDHGLVGGRNTTERAAFVKKNLAIATFAVRGHDEKKAQQQQQPQKGQRQLEDKFDVQNDDQKDKSAVVVKPTTTSTTAETIHTTSNEISLPTVVSLQSDSELDNGDNVCAICLLAFTPGDEVSFSNHPKCPHMFHTSCISSWLQRQEECPCCRCTFLLEFP